MPPTDQTDLDPLADLDDDLGEDWESAFQSEDFMFSPDEEANDFFLFDENDPEEDIDELTSIMENAEEEVRTEQEEESKQTASAESNDADTADQTLPAKLIGKATAGLSFFKNLPLYQRAIITAIPSLILLFIMATFFLRSTSEEFAQTEEQDIVIADITVGPEKDPISTKEHIAKAEPTRPPEKKQTDRARTIRKQWDFPTFTIVSSNPSTETLFVNVNLSLIAILPEGASLPEEKNVLVKDIIYQFYQNRSPAELKRFALARGEMIHKLHNWLQKEWPDSPINTVIFSKYQVIRPLTASR